MLKSICNKKFKQAVLPIFMALSIPMIVHAEVYKWRDSAGRIQYSDRAPIKQGAKPTQKLIRAVLDTQAACSVKPSAKNSGAAKLFEMNFFGIPSSTFGVVPVGASPLNITANRSFFGFGINQNSWGIGAWARPKPKPRAKARPKPLGI